MQHAHEPEGQAACDHQPGADEGEEVVRLRSHRVRLCVVGKGRRMTGNGAMVGPLSGIRVIELAGLGAAPYAMMLLADLGADVVRVDRPGAATDPNVIAHVALWRGRRSLVLDLKHQDAAGVLDRLLAESDVLVEGFRPGTMERLGLGPETVCVKHPRLVYARMTGWGQEGPLARTAGHDLNFTALSGALHTIGPAHLPPPPVANYLADLGGGGMLLALGVLAALIERDRSGHGQVIDAAMIDGAASLTTFVRGLTALGAWSDRRGANLLDGGAPFYATYACADGRYVAVGAIEPQFFRMLVTGLGLPDELIALQHDVSRWSELRTAIAGRFGEAPRDVWVERFLGTDACVTPVLDLAEVAAHPHHHARGTFAATLEGPVPPGAAGHPMPAPSPRFSRTPGAVGRGAPVPGQHTRELLNASGLAQEAIDELLARGVVSEA
jgi:alpha-methylacyl-CoA racemase